MNLHSDINYSSSVRLIKKDIKRSLVDCGFKENLNGCAGVEFVDVL